MVRNSKQEYSNSHLNGADVKTFWKTVRLLNCNTSSIPTLTDGLHTAGTSMAKATILNNFFYKCFNKDQPPLSSSQTEFTYDALLSCDCPIELLCTEESVQAMLTQLDASKSTGTDGISPKMLKCASLVSSSTARLLSNLFNLSISTGTIPSAWKVGRITPIPKGSNNSHPSGYRPISVLPVVSKIIERHIKDAVETFLKSHCPISTRQWGFMAKRSTVSALIRVVEDWLHALDQGFEVCVVFFDISKAFDTVPHLALLHKLQQLRLNPYLIRWIRSFLCQRSQFVCIDGCNSHSLPVTSGVPQGSVLGPLLFVLYINEVVSTISAESDVNMFTDDIALYRIIRTASDYRHLQDDIDSIAAFIDSKNLKFNAEKCKSMLITRKNSKSLPPPDLTLNGTVLRRVFSYRYLGITLTSNMSWSPHIMECCNKTRRLIGLLYRRCHHYSNAATLINLYRSFIRPHLEYASIVWNPSLKCEIETIENVQKFALRMCTKSWDSNYDNLLAATNLSSLKDRRTRACLCHLFKIVHGITEFADAPITHQVFNYNTRSSGKLIFCTPRLRTLSYKHSFFPSTIATWNNLPRDAANCNSLNSFKNFLLSM